jgi:hypothetical protein
MKRKLAVLAAWAMVGFATLAQAEHRSNIPDGVIPAVPSGEGSPCDILIRYDDGVDDSPGSGPTLGYFSGQSHQFLGIRSTAPAGGSFQIQSAAWFSDFWVLPGMVDVTVTEIGNPANSATGSVNVTDGGTWEVIFDSPICVPGGADYSVMVCPRVGVFGVVGEDLSGPDGRSYWSPDPCDLVNNVTGADYMIWSCVTECGPTPTIQATWGAVKATYR